MTLIFTVLKCRLVSRRPRHPDPHRPPLLKRNLFKIYYSYAFLLFPLLIPSGGNVISDGRMVQPSPKPPPPISIQAPQELQPLTKLYVPPKTLTPTTRAVVSSAGNTYVPGQCTWGVKNWKPAIPNGLGNANTWVARARAMGMATGSTPRLNAVAAAGNHVALVIGINGSTITLRDMNWTGPFQVSTRTASAASFSYIY